MIELDNTMLLFIGSENYSGKKIPWTEMSVRVRLSPRAQKDLENRNIFIIFVVESSLILLFYIWRVSDLD